MIRLLEEILTAGPDESAEKAAEVRKIYSEIRAGKIRKTSPKREDEHGRCAV